MLSSTVNSPAASYRKYLTIRDQYYNTKGLALSTVANKLC